MGLHVLVGLLVVLAAFWLSIAAALSTDQARQQRLAGRVRRLVLGYGALAFALALFTWCTSRDWVHLLWTSTHPQIALVLGAGAFLVRDEWERQAGVAASQDEGS